MGLFNRFRKSESTPKSSSESASTAWDHLGDDQSMRFGGVESSPESQADRIKRQGNKIIATIMRGDPSILGIKDIEVSDAERSGFYDALNDGRITEEHKRWVLQNINLPAGQAGHEDFSRTFSKIDSKHGRTILAFAGGFDLRNLQALDQKALASFLQAYPTPIDFKPRGERLIAHLEQFNNTPTKIAEYEEDLEKFQKNVYGKRYDYYQAFDVLDDLAKQDFIAKYNAAHPQDYTGLMTPTDRAIAHEDAGYQSPESQSFYGVEPGQE